MSVEEELWREKLPSQRGKDQAGSGLWGAVQGRDLGCVQWGGMPTHLKAQQRPQCLPPHLVFCLSTPKVHSSILSPTPPLSIPQKIKNTTNYHMISNPISGYGPKGKEITNAKRGLRPHIHGSIIHNSQDVETTYVSMCR